ncbi:MAG TPA: ATPase, T2SS/T4P/T4SS family [Pseudomonadales bacterium]
MFVFDIVDAYNNKTHYKLKTGEYTLGKGDNCDIILSDGHVSREHASLTVSTDKVVLADKASTNGTWFNGKKIKKPIALNNGDEIFMGKLVLIVQQLNAPTIQASPKKPFAQSAPSVTTISKRESEEVIALKRKIHGLILEYLDLRKRANLQDMSEEELREETIKATHEVINQNIAEIPAEITKQRLIQEVVAEAVGLGALEPFLDDETVTEIMINGCEQLFVERNGIIQLTDRQFSSNQALRGVIDRIVAPLGRRIDEGSPMVDARLPDGSRVNAIIPPLALNGPTMTIRKFSRKSLGIDDLVGYGSLDYNMASFLKTCVEYRRNIVISGGTGSGKTTTLNILSNFIDNNQRIITIEDAAELNLNQTHVVSLESRPANTEGKGLVSIRELVVNALRMRPDRIIVGECRSGETLDMLQAMNTGHTGSMTTGHANTPRDFLSRLEVMVLMAGIDLPSKAIREQIASAIDIIIQQNRLADGTRRITQIVEVTGMEGDTILLQPLFEYKKIGFTPDGKVKGYFTGNGYAPQFYNDMEEAGTPVDRSIFRTAEEKEDMPKKINSLENNEWN